MTKNLKSNGIKSWPLDDRPREKLFKKGAGTLSNYEFRATFCVPKSVKVIIKESLIAESQPKEKDIIAALVVNLINKLN